MTVVKIVANLAATDVAGTAAFYERLFGMNVLMEMGWITTLSTGELAPVQLSIASEGGGGAPVPDLSIQVDDVDAVHDRAQELGIPITYPLTDEPWGVRRFFVNDGMGRVLNILGQH